MKKIVGLLLVAISLTACDDGDLVFENLNFNGKPIQKCPDNELYFKTNDTELLLVDFSNTINGVKGSVLDTLAPLGETQNLLTSNTTKIYYRTYDAPISANAICSLLAPANPKVTSEYTSLPGGKIFYTRLITPIVTETAVNVNYTYTINFENITLTNGTSEIKYATLPYGSYAYDTSKMNFNFTNNFIDCNNVLVGKTSTEIVQIQLPEDFVFPTTNQTQTINLNSTNLLRYYVFRNPFTVEEGSECELPNEPIKEDWQVNNGSLQIETTVITNGTGTITGYRHNLKLIQAQFKKDDTTFSVTDRNLGNYTL